MGALTRTLTQNTSLIEKLNEHCFCIPAQSVKMNKLLNERLQSRADITSDSDDREFNPFSDAAVFLRQEDFNKMSDFIEAMERIVKLTGYQVLAHQRHSNLVKNKQFPTHGLMMGYDFHITAEGPKLIEINTNAGGAFVAKMLGGQAFDISKCCDISSSSEAIEGAVDDALYKMFMEEWRLARPSQMLKTVAIVDENIKQQYLYPDMQLAAKFLTDKGIDAFVCDLKDLRFVEDAVFFNGKKIDMIYNRHTDFMLDGALSKELRDAYEKDQIVLSPAPIHHAYYADKRNLELLADKRKLIEFGADEATCKALSLVPNTKLFSNSHHEKWWRERKKYFFKPHSGFGSRGAYRGDKLTKKVWQDIKSGGFIAQEFVQPSTRNTEIMGDKKRLKYDIRVYAYAGKPLFMAARLYSGQTTNFRTTGGGFAEVIVL